MRRLLVTGFTVILGSSAALAHDGDPAFLFAALTAGPNVETHTQDGWRYLQSDGLPDHETGRFPNRNNPNRISAQRYRFRMALDPQPASRTTPVGMNLFGVGVNGVPFDPGAAEFWQRNPRSGWQYEALGGAVNLGLDDSNAHVQPNGAYHYHGIPTAMVRSLARADSMILTGYAADGFPIYALLGHETADNGASRLRKLTSSYQLKRGRRPAARSGPGGNYDGSFVQDYEYVEGSGDLDECNGRTGVTPESPDGTYYYVLTDTFPFVPRMWKGTPDRSFAKGPPSGRGGPPGRGRPPLGHRPPPR